MRASTLLALLALLLAAPSALGRTLVHAGLLIDGISAEALRERTIVVVDDRIVEVLAGHVQPGADDELIDLRDHTVLPGLMDMHTHLASEMSKKSYLEEFRLAPTDYAMRAVAHARRTLRAGFTTVRDLGDDGTVVRALRDGIRDGYVEGPRIFTAGKSLATTGGHADPTSGWGPSIQGDPGPKEGVVNGPDEARKAVRQRYKDGADLIKLTATVKS